MKIRTDFVTNSSSNSYACLVINNPVLLEILQRYKDLEVFGDNRDLDFYIGTIPPDDYVDWERFGRVTKIPSFYFNGGAVSGESRWTGCPKSLNDVLTYIISIMDEYEFSNKYDMELHEQMLQELNEKQQEIKEGYVNVLWETSYDLFEKEIGDPREAQFSYDPENGEKYEVEYYQGD